MKQRWFRTFTQIYPEYFFYFGEKTISLLMSFSVIENPALCELRFGLLRVVTNLSKSLIEARVKFCRLIVICIPKHLKIKKFIRPWWGHKKYWTLLFIFGKIKNQNKRVQSFCWPHIFTTLKHVVVFQAWILRIYWLSAHSFNYDLE